MIDRDEVSQDTKDALEMMLYKDVEVQGTLKGFTPVMDGIAKRYGLFRAAVFGSAWRHCQMRDRVCCASMETISEELGIERSTVNKHMKALAADGYLKDLTPDRRNRPHVYKDTGKVKLGFSVTVDEITPTVDQITPTVDITPMRIDSKIDSKKENLSRAKTTREPTPLEKERYELQTLFSELTHIAQPTAGDRSAPARWYQPLRRIQQTCNGRSAECVRLGVDRMLRRGLSISAPQSVEKETLAAYVELAATPSSGFRDV